ncbi:uncharacterized protein LOC116773204 [Danaus plexippus]|uniref:uncharacterized protein LOC116773204 n=1 Tax=Danaus plexippus TaxID=13037 RepID=UPI002AB011A6|nr:uncharacterized protein LOC116773204 [Danaus plexippus]
MDKIKLYNEYLFKLRSLSLREPYIEVHDNINPMLKHYMKLLDNISFKEESYHTYYGNIKRIVNSFTIRWTNVMDEAIKITDKYIHFVKREDLEMMIAKMMEMQKEKQDAFVKQFANSDDPIEKEKINEIQELYNDYMKKVELLSEKVNKLDKQEKVEEFAKEHLPQSLQIKNKIFRFTYDFIALKLALAVDRIRTSLEEIINRLRNNLKNIQNDVEGSVSELLMQLYEKNKENLILSRQDVRSSKDLAEVKRGMDIIIDKIEHSKNIPENRLSEECEHWEKVFQEFKQIEKTLQEIQKEENCIHEQIMASDDSEDQKNKTDAECWTMDEKLAYLKKAKLKAAKALFTFFSVRGENYIYYTDRIGTYFVDEYGHQVYVFDYGLNEYHVNCDGNFVNHPDKEKYYYDENGRYIIGNGQRLYQLAPCTSKYLVENDVFVKHSKDCGHSEMKMDCGMQIKDQTHVTILPDVTPVDIKGTLDSEVIKYIWDTFGHILPEVMQGVAEIKPKNPIHCLAHKLVQYKCKRTSEKDKRDAILYHQQIYEDRREKVNALYKLWRDKQIHVKPEGDNDDALRAHREAEELVRGLNYYN